MVRSLQRSVALGIALVLSLLCSCRGEPQKIPESQPTAVSVESDNKDSYAEAYCEVLTYLLDQHGYVHSFSTSSEEWSQAYEGLEYAALADLEQDGVPELICGYRSYIPSEHNDWDEDRRVSVFRYDDGVVRELLNVPYDTRMECLDDWVMKYLYLKTDENEPFLMVTDCKRIGGDWENYVERASIFTLEDGTLRHCTAVGRAVHKDGDMTARDDCYVYTACLIEGNVAPVDEYVHLIDSYAQKGEALWTHCIDEDESSRDQAALQTFLDELTVQAGAEKIDLADYTEAKKQRRVAPYEGEPYALGDVREEAAKLTPPTPTDNVLREYQAAERTLLTELVAQYWQPGFDPHIMSVGSFGYDKVDFESDGLPEIIVRCAKDEQTNVFYIYRYVDEHFDEILCLEETSDNLGGGVLTLRDWNHVYFTIVHGMDDEVGVHHSLYYAIQNGTLVCTDLTCDTDWSSEKAVYSNCTINGEAVSPEAYEAAVNPYFGSYWCFCAPLDENELRSLASGLGMSSEEINQLLKTSS